MCPSCGYCQHCGRGGQSMPLYPSGPYMNPWPTTGGMYPPPIGGLTPTTAGGLPSFVWDNTTHRNA